MKDKILASLTPECRAIYIRLEEAADAGLDLTLDAEETACLKRLFVHVISMNIRIEEFMDA